MGSFSWHGVGPLVKIEGNIDKFSYLDILKNILESYIYNVMPVSWIFLQKYLYTSKSDVKLAYTRKNFTSRLASAKSRSKPDRGTCGMIKERLGKENLKISTSLGQEEWNSIPLHRCHRLIETCHADVKRWLTITVIPQSINQVIIICFTDLLQCTKYMSKSIWTL